MEGRISTFGRLPDSLTPRIRPDAQGPDAGLRALRATPLVGLIRNPRSHRNKRRGADLADRADVLVSEPRTRAELEEALATFAKAGIGMLAISGGDGTVRDVLTRGAALFADNWPEIAVLPQGKTNALALDLGVRSRTTLDDAIAASRRGQIVARRPIVVTDRDSEARDRWGFIFGAGVFNAAIDAGQVAHRFGAFQSFAIAVTAVFGISQALFGFGRTPWRELYRMKFTDAASGEPLPHADARLGDSRYMVGFTTLRRFPLGMKLLAGVEGEHSIGYFMIDAPRRRTLAVVPIAAMGWHGPALARFGMHRGGGEAFDVALDDGFILDGERFPAGRFRMATGPELRFVVP